MPGHNMHEGGMPEPEKIKELLDVVAEKIPGLLKNLSDVMYGPEQAKNYATAIAIFYKELKAAGMTDEQAYELTQKYMSNLDLGGLAQRFSHEGRDCE